MAVPFLLAISGSGLQPKADTAIRPPAAAQRDTVQILDAVVRKSDIDRTGNQAVARKHKWQRSSKCANDARQCCRGDSRIESVLQSLQMITLPMTQLAWPLSKDACILGMYAWIPFGEHPLKLERHTED